MQGRIRPATDLAVAGLEKVGKMVVEVYDLKERALDYAVSLALGHQPVLDMQSHGGIWPGWWERTPLICNDLSYRRMPNYSQSWADSGPIIEREEINVFPMPGGVGGKWRGEIRNERVGVFLGAGQNPILAAMRCFVLARLGEKVDIPAELI